MVLGGSSGVRKWETDFQRGIIVTSFKVDFYTNRRSL